MAGEKQADEILMYWRLIVGGLQSTRDSIIPVPAVAIASRGEDGRHSWVASRVSPG